MCRLCHSRRVWARVGCGSLDGCGHVSAALPSTGVGVCRLRCSGGCGRVSAAPPSTGVGACRLWRPQQVWARVGCPAAPAALNGCGCVSAAPPRRLQRCCKGSTSNIGFRVHEKYIIINKHTQKYRVFNVHNRWAHTLPSVSNHLETAAEHSNHATKGLCRCCSRKSHNALSVT